MEYNEDELFSNGSFCPLPWIHQYVQPTGMVSTCPIGSGSIGNVKDSSLEEIWNNDTMKQIRLDMLSGKKVSHCAVCNTNSSARNTQRQNTINDYRTTPQLRGNRDVIALTNPDGSLPDHKLTFIDFRFSNVCNLKCRICGPEFSVQIASEMNKHKKIMLVNKDEEMPVVLRAGKDKSQLFIEAHKHIDSISYVYFAGGEPLIQFEHWKLLDSLIESGRAKEIALQYSSNMTAYMTAKSSRGLIDKWKQFRVVNCHCSFDGFGEAAEYWRSGTDKDKLDIILRELAADSVLPDRQNIIFTLHTVLAWPNLENYIKFITYLLDNNLLTPNMDVSMWLLTNIDFYSLQVLPRFKKDKYKELMISFIDELKKRIEVSLATYGPTTIPRIDNGLLDINRNLHKIIGFVERALVFMEEHQLDMTPDDVHGRIFKQDTIRGEDFFTAFPEHEDMRELLTRLDAEFVTQWNKNNENN